MPVLLDRHAFLWFIEGSPQLSTSARDLIAHRDTERLLSVASLWEMSIKISLGRLESHGDFAANVRRMLDVNRISIVELSVEALGASIGLPFHHRDSFDRMLVAQSLVMQTPIVSNDRSLDAYGIDRIW